MDDAPVKGLDEPRLQLQHLGVQVGVGSVKVQSSPLELAHQLRNPLREAVGHLSRLRRGGGGALAEGGVKAQLVLGELGEELLVLARRHLQLRVDGEGGLERGLEQPLLGLVELAPSRVEGHTHLLELPTQPLHLRRLEHLLIRHLLRDATAQLADLLLRPVALPVKPLRLSCAPHAVEAQQELGERLHGERGHVRAAEIVGEGVRVRRHPVLGLGLRTAHRAIARRHVA